MKLARSILVFLILTGVFLVACSRVNVESQDYYTEKHKNREIIIIPSSSEFDAHAAVRGELLYKKHCLQCHGKEGKHIMEAVNDHPSIKPYLSASQRGQSMPGWKHVSLGEQELTDLGHYLRKLAKK